MKNELWGNTHKITPWRESFDSGAILGLPLPKRDSEDISNKGIKEDQSQKIGFKEGRLSNGYPFRLECAVYKQSKILSVFVSKNGLTEVSGSDMDYYLRSQNIYEVYEGNPEIYTYIDKNENEFWRIDVLLETDGTIYASSPISIEEFNYGHNAHEFRLLLKENTAIFKAYYNEDGVDVEYSVCILKEKLFKLKFKCYILSILEIQKLVAVLSKGRNQTDIVKLLEDYFETNSPDDFHQLLEEKGINYNIREEF